MDDREKFLAERASCIGGSDAADLLDLAPYGCRRKLWYDKKGVEPDFPFNVNFHMRRGTALEPIAIAEFCREFHATLEAHDGYGGMPPPHKTMATYSYIGCHVDGFVKMLLSEETEVLEIKVPSNRHFQKIKASGVPPLSWQVQAQWNMMVVGLASAQLGIFNPDLFKIIKFPVKEDPDLQTTLQNFAHSFWQQSLEKEESPYQKLKDGDARCEECQWRTKCKGIGQTIVALSDNEKIDVAKRKFLIDDRPHLVNLVNAYEEAGEERREAEKFYNELKDELKEELHGDNIIIADGRRVFAQETQVPIAAKAAHVQKRVSIKVLEAAP